MHKKEKICINNKKNIVSEKEKRCTVGITVINTENETDRLSSNSRHGCCVYFAYGKGMNSSFLLPTYCFKMSYSLRV